MPDHWPFDDYDPVGQNAPIRQLIAIITKSTELTETEDTEAVKDAMHELVQRTATQLMESYSIFEDFSIQLVGSVMEKTKINLVDEFDFSIILPKLAGKAVFDLLFHEESIYNNQYISDLCDNTATEEERKYVFDHLHATLKFLWMRFMIPNIPEGWELLDSSCSVYNISIAETSHLRRLSDGFRVDIDICFWIPIKKSDLSSAPETLEQKNFLIQNCFDKEDHIHAILPKDQGIYLSVNTIRFSMSILEAEMLHQNGPDNGRLKCYKLAKSIVSYFLPKMRKATEICQYCENGCVPSFCLKQIVFYMMSNYVEDSMWTDDQLGNRLYEVFAILAFCMKVNAGWISAFLSPYQITTNTSVQHNPERKHLEEAASAEQGETDTKENVCVLPYLTALAQQFENPVDQQLLEAYSNFLRNKAWKVPHVLCLLEEILSAFTEEDEDDRKACIDSLGITLTFFPEAPDMDDKDI